jgi:hypothetical protein
MYITQFVLIKYETKIVKGIIIGIFQDDLEIKLEDESIVKRKFWEVRKINEK